MIRLPDRANTDQWTHSDLCHLDPLLRSFLALAPYLYQRLRGRTEDRVRLSWNPAVLGLDVGSVARPGYYHILHRAMLILCSAS